MKVRLRLFSLALIGLVLPPMALAHPQVQVDTFPQEISRAYSIEEGLPDKDILSIKMGSDGLLYAATPKGTACFQEGRWKLDSSAIMESHVISRGPYALVGNQTGLFRMDESGKPVQLEAGQVNQLAQSSEGLVAVAMETGLLEESSEGNLQRVTIEDAYGRQWAASKARGVVYDSEDRLCVATPAGLARRDRAGWRFFTGKEGLPYNDFTCLAAGPKGLLWMGTRLGAIRFDGAHWAYRQGNRWLPDDEVRAITVDAQGNAWFATPKGVGYIGFQEMTLQEKAEYYEAEIEHYIKRTPFGYTSEVSLEAPGDKSEIRYSDSDNDGLWTSMYGAGECFAYAATKAPEAKKRAKQAFEALRFLQKVTQGTPHSPPKGYVARTIRSVDLPDPNVGRVEHDQKQRDTKDTMWKVYEPRWPKSADGKWYFKTDTSSDELDGHYFFYPLYHDLVAESPEEKERVKEVVRDLTDHFLEHGYYLVDHDGTPTRWSVFGPPSINHDRRWIVERGLNSLSMLSYLCVAHHMTGDSKYADAVHELMKNHAYHANLMYPKLQFGIGSGNQSDDEMAFMSFYNLIKYAVDDDLRERALFAFYQYWMLEAPEMNPFFNFAYAAVALGQTYEDQWGTHPLDPWDGWLEDSMQTLLGFPLDRLNWGHKNSHRLDLVRLPRQQAGEPTESPRDDRGYRVNGKVIPVEERHFNHWNTDPWCFDYGGNGQGLASGTVFLLPYYMGRYHDFIAATK